MNAIAGGRRRRKGTNSTRWGPEGESGSCNRREPHSLVEILIFQDAEQRSGLFERRQAEQETSCKSSQQVGFCVSQQRSGSPQSGSARNMENRDQLKPHIYGTFDYYT